jgi:hypothetical protein
MATIIWILSNKGVLPEQPAGNAFVEMDMLKIYVCM